MKLSALLLIGLAACGWHQGLVAPLGAENAQTIGLEIFGNETLQPGIEADFAGHLSAALVDYVQLDLTTPERSDLVIRGTMTRFRRRNGIRSENNVLLEGSVRVEVKAQLVRRSDDLVLATSQTGLWAEFPTGNTALSAPGLGEVPALERLYRNLADRLILDLMSPPH